MPRARRSGCPIAFSLDLFGDRWSLLILRDLAFRNKRYYQDFLTAGEGVATNVLAERLERLESAGLVRKAQDPDNRRRYRYTLTPKGIDTLPILVEIILWGSRYDPHSGAPPELLERMRTDRDAFLEATRAELLGET